MTVITLPNIGDISDAEVIEVLVKPGDEIAAETPVIVLETDKATMDIPSPSAGVIDSIEVKVGDKISEGHNILTLSDAANTEAATPEPQIEDTTVAETAAEPPAAATGEQVTVTLPDIGDAGDAEIIEVQIAVGDVIEEEAAMIVLETDKAAMDVPSSHAGTVKEVLVAKGDRVSTGAAIAVIETAATETAPVPSSKTDTMAAPVIEDPAKAVPERPAPDTRPHKPAVNGKAHAGPAVRKLARKLGVDLTRVAGTGPRGRILKEDVQDYVKQVMQQKKTDSSGLSLTPRPEVDFSQFGEIETQELTKINRLTGTNTHRSWVSIPHVTQFDEADITELDDFRKSIKAEYAAQGINITLLPFIMKAVVSALRELPRFNASLDSSGENLILKKYYHIGIAVDTPHGLLVPVVKDVDKKSVSELATEVAELAEKARNKRLSPQEMQGGCFTISSLGHIGGTGFTPIINEPEVGILGLSRATMKPVYDGQDFQAKLMLPLSLSYDHRVIDGVLAARFTRHLSTNLADARKLLL